MEPIHQAALDGNEAEVNRLVAEDEERLNAKTQLGITRSGVWYDMGSTPLMVAAIRGQGAVVARILALGADVGLRDDFWGWTALHGAARNRRAEIVRLLLDGGADPRLPDNEGETPLEWAQYQQSHECVALLETAIAEPQRARTLLKARALIDSAHAIRQARADARGKESLRTRAAINRKAATAAPVYLKQRVGHGREPPRVEVVQGQGGEQLVACLKYALGLEEGGMNGMVKEVFVELCEFLVPKWDRGNV